MKNKTLWSSFIFLLIALLVWNINLFRFRQRKCAPYKKWKFDITFSNRKECLRSVGQSQLGSDQKTSYMSTLDEIKSRGYTASTYTILSKDGYYSSIYRIAGSKKSPPYKGKRAMLLFHGGGASAASWIIQAKSRNLAFTMVDAGYEVWLPNARGTVPSKNHTHLNADADLAYWNFSSEEMALEDLPLYIDLMLEQTGTKKLYYACHSMGCGIYLMGLSEIPELNNKIHTGFLLAPAAHAGSADNPLSLLLPHILGTPFESILFRFLGGKMNRESSFLAKKLGLTFENICTWSAMRCGVCDNFLFALYGADAPQVNYTGLPNVFGKLKDNLSLKVLYHYAQNNEACDFRRYDHGIIKNLMKYGTPEPPQFNLSRDSTKLYERFL